MYACINETAISNKKTKITNTRGITKIKKKFLIIKAQNFEKIPINVWPANILANNRIERLKGLIAKEKISIKIIKSSKIFGTPAGTKNLKKFNPEFNNPITIKLIKILNDKYAVIKI